MTTALTMRWWQEPIQNGCGAGVGHTVGGARGSIGVQLEAVGVEKDHPGQIAFGYRHLIQIAVQQTGQPVVDQHVDAMVENQRRIVRHGVEQPAQLRANRARIAGRLRSATACCPSPAAMSCPRSSHTVPST